ncbi:MAG: glycosyltransferase family 4 protein [Acidimicrobiia bacterium]|nr:glycosyltransferase family 4 protein [Acidimicrobiia bacterium]
MKWVVASPYFEGADDRWITDSVHSDRHSFTLIPRSGQDRNWHQTRTPRAGFREWGHRVRQARWATTADSDGIITVFPQLAAATGSLLAAGRKDRALVSWFFNTEGLSSPVRRSMARFALRQVDRFVVHSTREIESYADLLGIPSERFVYVPLQFGATVEMAKPDDLDEPYVFATGSGYRDYGTFFDAVAALGYRTLVLASDRVLEGLTVPDNVEILEQITRPEIRRLVRHARVNVVPLNDGGTTAGLVTIVETFRHGRAVVITDRPGLEDYVFDGKNSLCSRLYDARSMAEAIETMWTDHAFREELDAGALRFAEDNCTDEVAGRSLLRILDSLA